VEPLEVPPQEQEQGPSLVWWQSSASLPSIRYRWVERIRSNQGVTERCLFLGWPIYAPYMGDRVERTQHKAGDCRHYWAGICGFMCERIQIQLLTCGNDCAIVLLGWIDACAGPLLRYRRQIGGSNIAVFCDIKKKHSAHAVTQDVDIAQRKLDRAADNIGRKSCLAIVGMTKKIVVA